MRWDMILVNCELKTFLWSAANYLAWQVCASTDGREKILLEFDLWNIRIKDWINNDTKNKKINWWTATFFYKENIRFTYNCRAHFNKSLSIFPRSILRFELLPWLFGFGCKNTMADDKKFIVKLKINKKIQQLKCNWY